MFPVLHTQKYGLHYLHTTDWLIHFREFKCFNVKEGKKRNDIKKTKNSDIKLPVDEHNVMKKLIKVVK